MSQEHIDSAGKRQAARAGKDMGTGTPSDDGAKFFADTSLSMSQGMGAAASFGIPEDRRKLSIKDTFRGYLDRFMGVPTLMPKVLDAVQALETLEVAEPSARQIYEELHKSEHPKRAGQMAREDAPFKRSLELLIRNGQITRRLVDINEATANNRDAGMAYSMLVEEAPEPAK